MYIIKYLIYIIFITVIIVSQITNTAHRHNEFHTKINFTRERQRYFTLKSVTHVGMREKTFRIYIPCASF